MSAYYNEIDPAAAHILRALIVSDVIAPGDVDTRSIKDVMPDDLRGYTQCHFFAGGGLWSVAARLAGWPDDRPLWTGSCPCQPFSSAGRHAGTDDPRHLWPDFHRLIRARRPAVVMGEQVAGKAGRDWFHGVGADLEGDNFLARAVDIPACSVDAPHQRNRLYWIAVEHAEGVGRREGRPEPELRRGRPTSTGADASGSLVHGIGAGLEGYPGHGDGSWRSEADRPIAEADGASSAGVLSDADGSGRSGWQESEIGIAFERTASKRNMLRNRTFWSDAEWIKCHDGKARRAEPGLCLLVDGLPGRVDLWRVGGNAIVPEAAAEVIAAFMDVYGVPERAAA